MLQHILKKNILLISIALRSRPRLPPRLPRRGRHPRPNTTYGRPPDTGGCFLCNHSAGGIFLPSYGISVSRDVCSDLRSFDFYILHRKAVHRAPTVCVKQYTVRLYGSLHSPYATASSHLLFTLQETPGDRARPGERAADPARTLKFKAVKGETVKASSAGARKGGVNSKERDSETTDIHAAHVTGACTCTCACTCDMYMCMSCLKKYGRKSTHKRDTIT